MREAESDDLRRAVIGQHVVVSDLALTEVESFAINQLTHHLARQMFALDVPLRTLDALHLAAAIQSDCRMLVTYDRRLLEAAIAVGLAAGYP